jgi:hypothetical protein
VHIKQLFLFVTQLNITFTSLLLHLSILEKLTKSTSLREFYFRSAHEGAAIWSADVDPAHGLLYTGGGDASLKSWPIESLSLDTSTLLHYPKTETDNARTVIYFNDVLLCLTTRWPCVLKLFTVAIY